MWGEMLFAQQLNCQFLAQIMETLDSLFLNQIRLNDR
jgi:hypothetical protein